MANTPEPRRDLDMKITLNNVDIEFSLGWCHKHALVNFELQHKKIRTGEDLNIKQEASYTLSAPGP